MIIYNLDTLLVENKDSVSTQRKTQQANRRLACDLIDSNRIKRRRRLGARDTKAGVIYDVTDADEQNMAATA